MKQHKNNRDEQLYQQILAELKPGADEYDRIMAQGKQPARRRPAPYRYAAAACLLMAVAGLSVYLQKNVPAESPAPAVAEMEVTHQTENPQVSEPSPSPKEAIAEAPRAKRAAQRQPTVLPHRPLHKRVCPKRILSPRQPLRRRTTATRNSFSASLPKWRHRPYTRREERKCCTRPY